jgi:N-terminal domain on NACHT_NTPase and P-loop NTPases
MSGLEVIGGISAVIGIIDASIKIYNGARKDLKLSKTFEAVGRSLPIILDTLRAYQNHLEPNKRSLPADICEALEKTLDACKEQARKLREIFEEVIPVKDDAWEKRYKKVLKRLGNGSKVEELMISITEDVQYVVNNHAVKSATPEQMAKLKDIIKEMKSIKSSTPGEESSGMTFTSEGNIENYFNQDKGCLVVNREKVDTQNFGKY